MPHRAPLHRLPTSPRGLAHPGYPRGFSPLCPVQPSHEGNLRGAEDAGQGAADRIPRHRVGPAELDGRLKDQLRSAIHASRNPQRTRERIAEVVGSTAGEVKKVLEPARGLRLAAHLIPAIDSQLGAPVGLEVLAEAEGCLVVPLPDDVDGEGGLCDLLLQAGDAAGDLAHELRQARQATSAGGRAITPEELDRIERSGMLVLRSYHALMLQVRLEADGAQR